MNVPKMFRRYMNPSKDNLPPPLPPSIQKLCSSVLSKTNQITAKTAQCQWWSLLISSIPKKSTTKTKNQCNCVWEFLFIWLKTFPVPLVCGLQAKALEQLIPNLRSQRATQLCSQKHVQKAITGPFTDTSMP